MDEIKKFKLDPDVKAVIAGVDPWLANVKLFKVGLEQKSNTGPKLPGDLNLQLSFTKAHAHGILQNYAFK